MSRTFKPVADLAMKAAKPADKMFGNSLGTKFVEANPTTPLYRGTGEGAQHVVTDTLDLTGAQSDDVQRKADKEAIAIAAANRANIKPLPDDQAILAQQRRAQARRRSSGRASTILSDTSYGNNDSLGG